MISRRLLRILAMKALYQQGMGGSSAADARRALNFSIYKSYELYFQMLDLVVSVAAEVEVVLNQRKNKLRPTDADLNPSMRLPENRVVAQLRRSEAFNDFKSKNGISWQDHAEVVHRLALNLLESDYYAAYLRSDDNYDSDREFVSEFYLRYVDDFAMLYDALEEMSGYWTDEVEYFTSFVIKSVRSFKPQMCGEPGSPDLCFFPMYKDASDADFVKRLLSGALDNRDRYMGYIEEVTRNWDAERIAYMDKVIILLGISELENFPDIPLKVTLDEYIEISKYYSTQGSSVYVNGMLDKIASLLCERGIVEKR